MNIQPVVDLVDIDDHAIRMISDKAAREQVNAGQDFTAVEACRRFHGLAQSHREADL